MNELLGSTAQLREPGAKLAEINFNNESNGCELFAAAIESIEQGIWTVISYFAEEDLNGALTVARKLRCSVSHIHEFDWERFEETFGSKGKFLQLYSNTLVAAKAKATAHALVTAFKERAGIHSNNQFRLSQSDRVYRIGIVLGSAAGLGEIYKIDPTTANDISRIVSAPIAMDSSKLLSEIATFD